MPTSGPLPSECPFALLRDAPAAESACALDPVTSTAVLMYGSQAVIERVASHPGAIGYVSAGYLALAQGTDLPVRVVAVEGVPPEPSRLSDGSYPLVRPVYLLAPHEPMGAARLFVDFCLSPQGQALVAQGYAPVRPRR